MPQRYLERARAFVAARAAASSARPETGPAHGEVAAPDSRRQEAPRSAAGGVSLAARGPTGAPCRTCGSARWWRPLADRPDYWVCAICHPLPDASLPLAQPVALGAQVLAAARARRWPRLPLWPHLAVAAGEAAWRTFCATAGAALLRQAAEALGITAVAICPRCDGALQPVAGAPRPTSCERCATGFCCDCGADTGAMLLFRCLGCWRTAPDDDPCAAAEHAARERYAAASAAGDELRSTAGGDVPAAAPAASPACVAIGRRRLDRTRLQELLDA
ncbi:MAG: hypothetical protein IRZ14_20645, partial [Chloroflexi bacterium]|nr:hypothetical protein [Chloroflexota bacterium]